jgi:hypothetical protein
MPPTILMLDGLPSSSRRFEAVSSVFPIAITLSRPITRAFAQSVSRTPKTIAGPLEDCPEIIESVHREVRVLALHALQARSRQAVGFRMTLAHADRIEALIVPGRCGHNEGVGANWKTQRDS